MKHTLTERLLDPKTNQLVGYLTAEIVSYVPDDKEKEMVRMLPHPVVAIGYIVKHPKKETKHWQKPYTQSVAFDRGQTLVLRLEKAEDRNFPPLVRAKLPEFLARCKKYFKNVPLAKWADNLAQKLHL